MRAYSLDHLSDHALLGNLGSLATRDRNITASMLAHIAEVEWRSLYAAAACESMYAYCIRELRMSEDMAVRRLHAARLARRFPAIFPAIADGRLHLSAVLLLEDYLTESTADELLAAAEHKTKSEIRHMLAERFPQPDLPTQIRVLPSTPATPDPVIPPALERVDSAPDPVTPPALARVDSTPDPVIPPALARVDSTPDPVIPPALARVDSAPDAVTSPALARVETRPARVMPLSPKRYGLQVTIDQATHDKLRRAQELLGFRVSIGDVAQVLDRALDALIQQLEKQKFAATEKPRPRRELASANSRHIPAEVKRAVRARDGDQCTFVDENGRRCQARHALEFDHVEEFARGGEATVANVRQQCRAHNQYTAEQTVGLEFMRAKREDARRRTEVRRKERRAAG